MRLAEGARDWFPPRSSPNTQPAAISPIDCIGWRMVARAGVLNRARGNCRTNSGSTYTPYTQRIAEFPSNG